MKFAVRLCLILMLMLSTSAAFSLELGGSLGYNILLEDVDGGGLPALEGRLTFGETADVIRFGALVTYLPIFDYDLISSSSLGLMAFGKMAIPSAPIYVMAGAGLHLGMGGGSGSDLGIMLGGGFETPIAENMTLDIGLRFNMILASSSVKMLAILAGINYKL